MAEPWFDPNLYSWIPATALGTLAGVWGALTGFLAPRGRGKPLIYGLGMTLLGTAVLFLIAGCVALVSGQPYGIWYGLGLAGFIGVIVLGVNLPMVRIAYRRAEERRMAASDL